MHTARFHIRKKKSFKKIIYPSCPNSPHEKLNFGPRPKKRNKDGSYMQINTETKATIIWISAKALPIYCKKNISNELTPREHNPRVYLSPLTLELYIYYIKVY